MKGEARIFWTATRSMLLAGTALGLAACASVTALEPGANARIDPASPAAAAVAEAARTPGPWPTFADIPQVPADLRDAAAWRAAVVDQESEGAAATRDGADGWSLTATEAFTARAQAEIDTVKVHAPTAAEVAESEAYARALRARATPPPSPR